MSNSKFKPWVRPVKLGASQGGTRATSRNVANQTGLKILARLKPQRTGKEKNGEANVLTPRFYAFFAGAFFFAAFFLATCIASGFYV
jgi:hypothetical protein